MKIIRIENKNNPLPAPLQAIYCESFYVPFARFDGSFQPGTRRRPVAGRTRDSRIDTSIHMFFVYMDLAVIWINSAYTVVDTVLARSWRPAYAPRQAARYILEIHPSRLNEFAIGDHVEFQNG